MRAAVSATTAYNISVYSNNKLSSDIPSSIAFSKTNLDNRFLFYNDNLVRPCCKTPRPKIRLLLIPRVAAPDSSKSSNSKNKKDDDDDGDYYRQVQKQKQLQEPSVESYYKIIYCATRSAITGVLFRACRRYSLAIICLLTAASVAASDAIREPETLSNIPETLSGECTLPKDCKKARIQRPKSRKAETCTSRCVTTCIRGGNGAPGEGPFNVRRPIVVFKQGFRTRQYCLVECSDICNLIGDANDEVFN